jgi:hypothetical protein
MAPHLTATKSVQAPLSTRTTRSRRGASAQPVSATACSSTTTNRIQKAGSAPPTARYGRTRRSVSVVSTLSAPPMKPVKKAVAAHCVAITARSGYGDAHARREYEGMLQFVKAAHKAGVIDGNTAEKMSEPWQEKGVLEMKWKEEYLLPEVKEVQEIMDLKKAEAIARRRDAVEKKFLAAYFAGGKVAESKKDPLKTVRSGKISKKTSASVSKMPPKILPKIMEDDEPASPPAPAPKGANSASVQPLPGRPDYAPFTYYQLASLCFERNLVSGGNAPTLRSRLIQDDINVINQLPREAKPYSKDNPRGRKNKAPIVPNAPQAPPAVHVKVERKRGQDSEDCHA